MRATAEQQDDEDEDEEKLLREPIVLSGTPYEYPVKIGKDVVSGKGGRVRILLCLFILDVATFLSFFLKFVPFHLPHYFNKIIATNRPSNTIAIFENSLPTPIPDTMKPAVRSRNAKLGFVSISPLSRVEVAFWIRMVTR